MSTPPETPETPVEHGDEAAPVEETPPPREPAARAEDQSTWQPGLYLKIGVLLLVVGYSIAFVVENTQQIKIHFVFATANVHLIWEILLLLATGLVGGVLLSQLYRHRRRAQLAKKTAKSRHAGPDVGR
jgi:uncharacterized integral membrane protein